MHFNSEINIQLDSRLKDAFTEYVEKRDFKEITYSKRIVVEKEIDGLNDAEEDLYIEDLRKNGWMFLYQESNWPFNYTLIKDNDVMTFYKEEYMDKSKDFKTFYRHKVSIEKGNEDTSSGRTTNDTAKSLIQNYIKALPSDDYRYNKTIFIVVEKNEEEIYKNMGVQIFAAYTKDEFIGEYCIYRNYECESISHFGLMQIYTTDVDGDNEYELVRICDVGSGCYIIQLDIFKLINNDTRMVLYKVYTAQYRDSDTSALIIDNNTRE